MPQAELANAGEFRYTAADFEQIKQRLYQMCGIALSERKRQMVYSRLSRRLRRLELASFQAYLQLLEQPDHPEQQSFINALTTNKTSFYREAHHLAFLAEQMAGQNGQGTWQIWSAGCSTGEEPYSIASLLNSRGLYGQILATDLDTDVLEQAKRGIYELEGQEDIPQAALQQGFLRGRGIRTGKLKAREHLRKMIAFRQLNLLKSWPSLPKMDAIFCRNVMIYFDKHTQDQLTQRFWQLLKPNGLLFIGHSERLGPQSEPLFVSCGHTMFRKLATGNQ